MALTYEEQDHVCFLRGDAPLLLSAPHGGNVPLAGPDRRALTEKGRPVEVRTDLRCQELVQEVAQALAEESGRRPYVVFAPIHRAYVDPNRPPETGYHPDNEAARRAWGAYHERLRAFVDDLGARFGPRRSLLLDLHGANVRQRMREQDLFPGADPVYSLLLGSLKGSGSRSIAQLQAERGRNVLYAPGGLRPRLHGALLGSGAAQVPLHVWPTSEDDREYLPGYFILNTYGSHRPDGINALQLEHSRELRGDDTVRQDYARLLARAVWSFLQERRMEELGEREEGLPLPGAGRGAGGLGPPLAGRTDPSPGPSPQRRGGTPRKPPPTYKCAPFNRPPSHRDTESDA